MRCVQEARGLQEKQEVVLFSKLLAWKHWVPPQTRSCLFSWSQIPEVYWIPMGKSGTAMVLPSPHPNTSTDITLVASSDMSGQSGSSTGAPQVSSGPEHTSTPPTMMTASSTVVSTVVPAEGVVKLVAPDAPVLVPVTPVVEAVVVVVSGRVVLTSSRSQKVPGISMNSA